MAIPGPRHESKLHRRPPQKRQLECFRLYIFFFLFFFSHWKEKENRWPMQTKRTKLGYFKIETDLFFVAAWTKVFLPLPNQSWEIGRDGRISVSVRVLCHSEFLLVPAELCSSKIMYCIYRVFYSYISKILITFFYFSVLPFLRQKPLNF